MVVGKGGDVIKMIAEMCRFGLVCIYIALFGSPAAGTSLLPAVARWAFNLVSVIDHFRLRFSS